MADENSIDALFNSMPNSSIASVWNNERSFGIVVSFAEAGFGFGEIAVSVDKQTGEVHFDNEEMSMEKCGRIVARLVGTVVQEPEPEEL